MKVKELILKLQKVDQEAIVLSTIEKGQATAEITGFFEEKWTKSKINEYVLGRGQDNCINGIKLYTL